MLGQSDEASLVANVAGDFEYMARALQLARKGEFSAKPNPCVGCVIVRDGSILAEGFHERAGGDHAEVAALSRATQDVAGATAFVTLEPCNHHGRTGPCTEQLINAGISRVVVAAVDPNPLVAGSGVDRLNQAGISTTVGVLESVACRLNRGFFKRMSSGLPWVTVKIAMSMDGKIALANGSSQWITGDPARADVQRLRALSGAVLTGRGTALADNPRLNVRDERYVKIAAHPLRVVLDSDLSLPKHLTLFTSPEKTLVFTTIEDERKREDFGTANVTVKFVSAKNGRVDLQQVLSLLAELEINDVLVEAGPTLVATLIEQRLVDELIIYQAPKILGADATDAFSISRIEDLTMATELDITDVVQVGADLKISASIH